MTFKSYKEFKITSWSEKSCGKAGYCYHLLFWGRGELQQIVLLRTHLFTLCIHSMGLLLPLASYRVEGSWAAHLHDLEKHYILVTSPPLHSWCHFHSTCRHAPLPFLPYLTGGTAGLSSCPEQRTRATTLSPGPFEKKPAKLEAIFFLFAQDLPRDSQASQTISTRI